MSGVACGLNVPPISHTVNDEMPDGGLSLAALPIPTSPCFWIPSVLPRTKFSTVGGGKGVLPAVLTRPSARCAGGKDQKRKRSRVSVAHD
jgi:hypothetical protein